MVVITGAGSGIGRATARAFASEGARVHAVDVDADRLDDLAGAIDDGGGVCRTHVVDCTDADALAALARDVYDEEGRVDVLHNNAGIVVSGPTHSLTREDWEDVLDLNLRGVVYGVHAFLPRMLRQEKPGHIVNTASGMGLVPWPYNAPYATSKFGVVGMTEALAIEYDPDEVHFSVLCPGFVSTNLVRDGAFRGSFQERHEEDAQTFEEVGASPDKVASVVLDAVRRKKVIQITPKRQMLLPWLVRRLSPRLFRALIRVARRWMPGPD